MRIQTYSDWLIALNKIKKENKKEYYQDLKKGTLDDISYLQDLKNKIVEFVNFELTKIITIYKENIDKLISQNDFFLVKNITINFLNQTNDLLFFEELSFLNHEFKNELKTSYLANLTNFKQQLLNFIKKTTIENENAFELYYVIKKYLQ